MHLQQTTVARVNSVNSMLMEKVSLKKAIVAHIKMLSKICRTKFIIKTKPNYIIS